MSDIGIFINNSCFDLDILNDDIRPDDGLETSIIISLFTDKRVDDDSLPIGESSKRGWWGDALALNDLDQIGSRLWTLDRSKINNETLRRSEELAKESLEWMIEDQIASEIKIISEYNDDKHLIMNISVSRPNRDDEKFSILWNSQEIRRL